MMTRLDRCLDRSLSRLISPQEWDILEKIRYLDDDLYDLDYILGMTGDSTPTQSLQEALKLELC